jgi:hypothetical protein
MEIKATAQPDRELGGFMGVVTCSHEGAVIWKDSTGITRLTKEDAQTDADKMVMDLTNKPA